MGKNKKSDIEIYDPNIKTVVQIDSMEEWQVYNWVLELYEMGVLINYIYQPSEFQLTDKVTYVPYFNNPKKKARSLLQSHEYTADFVLMFKLEWGEKLSEFFKISENMINFKDNMIVIYIDIKGAFQRNGGARTFSINQKEVYDKYKIYVQKVVPAELFKTLGVPMRCLKGYKGRPSKIFSSCNFAKTIFASGK